MSIGKVTEKCQY